MTKEKQIQNLEQKLATDLSNLKSIEYKYDFNDKEWKSIRTINFFNSNNELISSLIVESYKWKNIRDFIYQNLKISLDINRSSYVELSNNFTLYLAKLLNNHHINEKQIIEIVHALNLDYVLDDDKQLEDELDKFNKFNWKDYVNNYFKNYVESLANANYKIEIEADDFWPDEWFYNTDDELLYLNEDNHWDEPLSVRQQVALRASQINSIEVKINGITFYSESEICIRPQDFYKDMTDVYNTYIKNINDELEFIAKYLTLNKVAKYFTWMKKINASGSSISHKLGDLINSKHFVKNKIVFNNSTLHFNEEKNTLLLNNFIIYVWFLKDEIKYIKHRVYEWLDNEDLTNFNKSLKFDYSIDLTINFSNNSLDLDLKEFDLMSLDSYLKLDKVKPTNLISNNQYNDLMKYLTDWSKERFNYRNYPLTQINIDLEFNLDKLDNNWLNVAKKYL